MIEDYFVGFREPSLHVFSFILLCIRQFDFKMVIVCYKIEFMIKNVCFPDRHIKLELLKPMSVQKSNGSLGKKLNIVLFVLAHPLASHSEQN